MKKLIVLFLAVVFVSAGVVGCGDTKPTTPAKSGTGTGTGTGGDKKAP